MREVYADHASTTRMSAEVVLAMRPFMEEAFGNASSVHCRGEAAREAIEAARAEVAALLGATAEEIVFTASGSEANTLAVLGALEAAPAGRDRLVVSAIEHPSVLESARRAEERGWRVTVVPVEPDGVTDPARLEAAMGADVALVSLMTVNNEVGTRQPVETAARIAHAAGALFHTDAVQAAGKIPLDVRELGADLASLAGHKFHGPPGTGALFVRRRTRVVPVIHGGHQERGRRAGTENLPALVGLGVAARLAREHLGARAGIDSLGERLAEGLVRGVPGCSVNGDRARAVPSIVNVRFEGVDGEAVLHELDREGIVVSTGSACSAAAPGPSHVLTAMGLPAEDAHASVRFSLGEPLSPADVDRILSVVPAVVERLRALKAAPVRRGA
jgi:cysteine desulfurase